MAGYIGSKAVNLSTTGADINGDANIDGDLSFRDNDKIKLGAGSDLQIYHDGSNSYVKDNGTGDLYLQGTANVRITNTSGQKMFLGQDGGEAQLYYNGSEKLATTSTGVDITGTLTSDGLTVENSTGSKVTLSSTKSGTWSVGEIIGEVAFDGDDTSGIGAGTKGSIQTRSVDTLGAGMEMALRTSDGSNAIRDRLIVAPNGDISFYEDTGTTAKFFWDASAERLAVGGTTANATLHVHGNSVVSNGNFFSIQSSSGLSPELDEASNGWAFTTNGSERMRIDSSGNVGIGSTTPNAKITLKRSGAGLLANGDDGTVVALIADTTGSVLTYGTYTSHPVTFKTANGERMRIDSSGNVGIGTSSPVDKLTVGGSTDPRIAVRMTSGGTDNSARMIVQTNSTATSNGDAFVTFDNNQTSTVGTKWMVGTDASAATFKIAAADLGYFNGTNEYFNIDSSGRVGIGTAPTGSWNLQLATATGSSRIRMQNSTTGTTDSDGGSIAMEGNDFVLQNSESGVVKVEMGGTERMRIDSSGNLLVGTTAVNPAGSTSAGVRISSINSQFSVSNDPVVYMNRTTSDGDIAVFRKDGSTVGSIGANGGDIYVGNSDVTLSFNDVADLIAPTGTNGATRDGLIDLGNGGNRFDDIFATNGTIQTSDRNEKQDIAELTDAEQRVAVAAKGLLRKFRWRDAVEAKGDDARTHFGIIAQDLQAAFVAEGLDAGDYAMFISSTWTDEETGEERTRMGVRYSELLAFIIGAL